MFLKTKLNDMKYKFYKLSNYQNLAEIENFHVRLINMKFVCYSRKS